VIVGLILALTRVRAERAPLAAAAVATPAIRALPATPPEAATRPPEPRRHGKRK
jgi:ABC-type phosphate transport system permease subunit